MDKIAKLEEFKNRLNNVVESRTMSIDETNRIVQECFDDIKRFCELYEVPYNCYENIDKVIAKNEDANQEIMSDRKEFIEFCLNNQIKIIENEVIRSDKLSRENRYNLENVDTDVEMLNGNQTSDYAKKVEDQLKADLSAMKTEIIEKARNMGYKQKYLDDVVAKIENIINKQVDYYGEEIYAMLIVDKRNMVNDLLEEYSRFEQEMTKEDQEKDNSFKGELASGISLEEQRTNSEEMQKRLREEQEKAKNNPQKDDEIRGLPDNAIS